jgi:aryl-alcohol dehydrogenase-like predicted oxidoreductase
MASGRLYEIHRDTGISLVKLFVRFALKKEGISVILVGAATPAELEESVEAVEEGPLRPDIQEAVQALGLPSIRR